MARSIEGFALDLTSTPRKGSAPPPVLTPASVRAFNTKYNFII